MYKIVSKKALAHKETLFGVEAPDIASKAKPGQFLIVVPHEKSERVPLTISGYDSNKGTVSFAFHEVGKTTKEMGCLNEGDCLLNVTGPLGNPSEVEKFGKVLCVGGSIMIAPAMLQVKAMKEAGNHVTTVLGCRSKDFLMMAQSATRG
jgi:ferredoxin--NADP+ reductase